MKNSRKTLLAVCLFFATTLGLFAPLDAFLGSITEFWFSLKHILPALLAATALLFLLVFILGRFLPQKAGEMWSALFFAFGCGLYLQGNFLNISYGVLDGKEIDWSAYAGYAVVNTFIWVTLIAGVLFAAWRFTGKFSIAARRISWLLVFVQLAGIVVVGVQKREHLDNASRYGVLTSEGLFSLGKEENVLIFVLDTFSADGFELLLQEHPEIQQILDGFQYFADFSTAYPTTRGALPLMLTGIYNENQIPINDYLEAAYENTAFYKDLNAEGFDVRIYTMNGFVPLSQALFIANKKDRQPYPSSKRLLTLKLYQYALFRNMPHVLKTYFWLYTGDFDAYKIAAQFPVYIMDNLPFYNGLKEERLLADKSKAYRFYHLRGIHSPYDLNENMEPVENSTEQQQSLGIMRMMGEYFQQLKALGLYDQATLIVTGDHPHTIRLRHLGRSRSLFLLKPKHAHGGMTTNFLPASHADILPTVMEEVLGKDNPYGFGLTHERMPTDRMRRLLYYSWNDSWDIAYLPSLTEYEVFPHAWEDSAYRVTGNIYTNGGVYNQRAYRYQGEVIDFAGEKQIGLSYTGFSGSENTFTWSDGNSSTLVLPVDNDRRRDYHAKVSYLGTFGTQRLIVKVGGVVVFEDALESGKDTVDFVISRELIDNELNIEFEYPDAKTPASLGMSDDPRLLAVQWVSMQFTKMK